MTGNQCSALIAIVDDDRSVQRALQDLIESEGLPTVCFGSAEEFLESGIQNSAACLIADVRMPGISGIDLQADAESGQMSHTDHLYYSPWRRQGRCGSELCAMARWNS